MPDPDNEALKVQNEHASYFGADNEEEPPETRYDPVEIDLGQPEPKKGTDGQPAPAPAPDPAAAQLRAQLNEARQQTAMAQRAAMEQAQRAQEAEQRAMGSTVGMIDSALEAAQAAAANAKAKLHAALDAADHRTAAQANEEIADARHNLLRLQEQRAYVQAEAQRQPQAVQPRQQQQVSQVEQITHDLVQSGFPRSADWLRAHHEWASRPELLDRISNADRHLVTNKGFVRETDEYFAALEQELGMGQQQRRSVVPDYSDNNVRRARAAAPNSNAAPSLRTGQTPRGRVALTPAQQEAAELSGMTNREYAESFEEARVAGKLLGYR
jgi:hypothetical protein